MIEEIQARLAELRQEYVAGEGRLRELAQQEAALRETMLRISGAIQVLEELIPVAARSGSLAPHADPPDGPPSEPKVLTVP